MVLMIFGVLAVLIGGFILGKECKNHDACIWDFLLGISFILVGAIYIGLAWSENNKEVKEKAINEYLNGEIEVEMVEIKTYKIK